MGLCRLNPLEVIALQQADLTELAKQSGVSYRQLLRIRGGKTQRIRSTTYAKLKPFLKVDLLDVDMDFVKRLRDLVERSPKDDESDAKDDESEWSKWANLAFATLQDPLRTGLRIHEAMVQRGWFTSDLANECNALLLQRKRLSSDPIRPGEGAWDLFVKRREALEKVDGITAQRIDHIITGAALTVKELILISSTLVVPPPKLFVPNKEGKTFFFKVLDYVEGKPKLKELAKILQAIRELVDLKP